MTSLNSLIAITSILLMQLSLSWSTSPKAEFCKLFVQSAGALQEAYYSAAEDRIHFRIAREHFCGRMSPDMTGVNNLEMCQNGYAKVEAQGKKMIEDVREATWIHTINQFPLGGMAPWLTAAFRYDGKDLTTDSWIWSKTQSGNITTSPHYGSPSHEVFHAAIVNKEHPPRESLRGYVFMWVDSRVAAIDACALFKLKADAAGCSLTELHRAEYYDHLDRRIALKRFIFKTNAAVYTVEEVGVRARQASTLNVHARPSHRVLGRDERTQELFSDIPSGFMYRERVYLFHPNSYALYSWSYKPLESIARGDYLYSSPVNLTDVRLQNSKAFFGCIEAHEPEKKESSPGVGTSSTASSTLSAAPGARPPVHHPSPPPSAQGSDGSTGGGGSDGSDLPKTALPTAGSPNWLLYGGILLAVVLFVGCAILVVLIIKRKQARSTLSKQATKVQSGKKVGGALKKATPSKKSGATPTTKTPTKKSGATPTTSTPTKKSSATPTTSTPTKKKKDGATPSTRTPAKKKKDGAMPTTTTQTKKGGATPTTTTRTGPTGTKSSSSGKGSSAGSTTSAASSKSKTQDKKPKTTK